MKHRRHHALLVLIVDRKLLHKFLLNAHLLLILEFYCLQLLVVVFNAYLTWYGYLDLGVLCGCFRTYLNLSVCIL
jgi:hypothetical protein